MSLGIFIFGMAVFAIVGAACWLIAYGILEERRDRESLEARQAEALEVAEGHQVTTRADGTTVAAD
jgi:hypothetical protein